MTLEGFILAATSFAIVAGGYSMLRRAGRGCWQALYGVALILGLLVIALMVALRWGAGNYLHLFAVASTIAVGIYLWRRS